MKHIFSILLVVGALFVGINANATIVRALSLGEMTRTADVVIQATVEASAADWDEGQTRIYTVTSLRVTGVLKGPVTVGETVRVRQIGGSVGQLTQMVAGNARFSVGEEVLVFLDRDKQRGLHYVIGMAQGKYSVDRRTTPPSVTRNVGGMTMLPRPGQAALQPAPNPGNRGVALPVFEDQIRSALRAP